MNVHTLPTISQRRLLEASGDFQFRFEELGVEIESGFSAGSFNGMANVTYWNDEDGLEWFVNDIYLDCSKWNGKSWECRTIEIERDHDLYIKLWGVLTEGSWKDAIESKVMEQL